MITRGSFVRLIARLRLFLINKVGEKKKQTRVKDMNIMFQIQTLILLLMFWSRLAVGQL